MAGKFSNRSGPQLVIDPASYRRLMRDLKGLDKEASRQLRVTAKAIAEDLIKPYLIGSIVAHAGNYAPELARSVRVKSDRIPTVLIGENRTGYFSGGASTNMIRYGTVVGPYVSETGHPQLWPPRDLQGSWPTYAAEKYIPAAWAAYEQAVGDIVTKWNRGGPIG